MKKLLPILLIAALLLTGCGVINPLPAEPTPSDEQLATRVAQILTAMPTQTVESLLAPSVVAPETEPTSSNPPEMPPTQSSPEAATETSEPLPTATTEPATATPVPSLAATVETAPVVEATASEAIPTPPPTSTVPPNDPRLRQGNAAFSDAMDNANNWPSGVDRAGFTTVAFDNGRMILTGLKTRSGWRLSRYGTDLLNFYIEMRVTPAECQDDDRYGIIYRVPVKSKPEQGYWFGLTCDGRFAVQKWDGLDGEDGKVTNLIYWTKNDAILAGANQTNRMGLLVTGKRMIVYANGVKLGETSDSTWMQGAFGVFVGARETKNFSIEVDQIDVWTNPQP